MTVEFVKNGKQTLYIRKRLDDGTENIINCSLYVETYAIGDFIEDAFISVESAADDSKKIPRSSKANRRKESKDNIETKTVFLLYGNDGRCLFEPYWYLNKHLLEDLNASINTAHQAANALRFLYLFLAAYDYPTLSSLNVSGWRKLQFFLGESRTLHSIQACLSCYRSYYNALNISAPYMFEAIEYSKNEILENNFQVSRKAKKYRNDFSTKSPGVAIKPTAISDENFMRMWELAWQRHDYTTLMLMHLMRVYGFRIGWCLSLTLEDIYEKEYKGKKWGILRFANRVSSDKGAKIKNHIPANTRSIYRNKTYAKEYQDAMWFITEETLLDLDTYISFVHEEAAEKYSTNYNSHPADSITDRFDEGDNRYIFLSSRGNVLSSRTVSNIFRRYYQELDIPIDKTVRGYGICHQFRHAFVEERIREGYDDIAISRMLGQKHPSSVMPYHNPSLEELAEETQRIVDYTFSSLPSLKQNVDNLLNKDNTCQ